ncbi:hypothetical protein UB46_30695 [Burkholderiaceae bacterium 16]|nr:hypothetical protein UB46_30695 [Burkholderiaceae bacterium 16]
MTLHADYIGVGGGSAGCVIVNRLASGSDPMAVVHTGLRTHGGWSPARGRYTNHADARQWEHQCTVCDDR